MAVIQRLNTLRESLNSIEGEVLKMNSNERIQKSETEKCRLAMDKMHMLNRGLDCKTRDEGRRQFLTQFVAFIFASNFVCPLLVTHPQSCLMQI